MPIKEHNGSRGISKQDAYKCAHGGVPAMEVWTVKQCWVFPYTHFLHACLNPSSELVITFATHKVVVSGRNLQTLQGYIAVFSLAMMKSTDHSPKSILGEKNVQIESIQVILVSEVE